LKGLGFRVQIVEAERGRANVIATLKGRESDRTLCAFAHMDVVPPGSLSAWTMDPFSGAIVDGRIYGRGASDHKFPISALIFAVKSILDTNGGLDGDLVLLFTADEETGYEKGLRFVLQKHPIRADAGLYAGPSSFAGRNKSLSLKRENVIVASSGLVIYNLRVKGTASHMMNLESGVNAISNAAGVVLGLEKLVARVNSRRDELTGRSRISVSMIQGGLGEAMIPDACDLRISRFLTPSESLKDARGELVRELGLLRRRNPALSVKITETVKTPISMTSPRSDLVRSILGAGMVVRGRKPATVGIPTFTDMGWFQKSLGVPTALFGYGDLAQAHRPNESISVRDLVDSSKAYACILVQLLAGSSGPRNERAQESGLRLR
jgi:acetylornithine deacetylase/succinyl-diaminopimelate desuccinylase-like protein